MTAVRSPDDPDSNEPPLAPGWVRYCNSTNANKIFYQHSITRQKTRIRPSDTEERRLQDLSHLQQDCAYWHDWISKVIAATGERIYYNTITKEKTTARPQGFIFTSAMAKREEERQQMVKNGTWNKTPEEKEKKLIERLEDVRWDHPKGPDEPDRPCETEEEWRRHCNAGLY